MVLLAMLALKGDSQLAGRPVAETVLRPVDEAGRAIGDDVTQPPFVPDRFGLSCPNPRCRRRWTLRTETFREMVLRASRAGLRQVELP